MKHDFKRPNGTTKRVQYAKAHRGGISSMGKRFRKGDAIVHLSSSRNTGETFVLLPIEMLKILGLEGNPRTGAPDGLARAMAKPGRWHSPKKWSEELSAKWHDENCWLVKFPPCNNSGLTMEQIEKGELPDA